MRKNKEELSNEYGENSYSKVYGNVISVYNVYGRIDFSR